MKLQIIRKDGQFRGVAWLLGNAEVIVAAPPKEELWRVCDFCNVKEAVVFCLTHAQYICTACLHRRDCSSVVMQDCRFMSVSAARELQQPMLVKS